MSDLTVALRARLDALVPLLLFDESKVVRNTEKGHEGEFATKDGDGDGDGDGDNTGSSPYAVSPDAPRGGEGQQALFEYEPEAGSEAWLRDRSKEAIETMEEMLPEAVKNADYTTAKLTATSWDDIPAEDQKRVEHAWKWEEYGHAREVAKEEYIDQHLDVNATIEKAMASFSKGEASVFGVNEQVAVDPASIAFTKGEGYFGEPFADLKTEDLRKPDGSKLDSAEQYVVATLWRHHQRAVHDEAVAELLKSEDYEKAVQKQQATVNAAWDQVSTASRFNYALQSGLTTLPVTPGEPKEWKWDSLHPSRDEDYQRVGAIARQLTHDRTVDLLEARGLTPKGRDAGDVTRDMAQTLWENWKGSSQSEIANAMHFAVAEELGVLPTQKLTAAHRDEALAALSQTVVTNEERESIHKKHGVPTSIRDLSPEDQSRLAGEKSQKDRESAYAVVMAGIAKKREAANTEVRELAMSRAKAYVRAQWEATQFLLHKTGQDEVNVFRGLMLERDDVDQVKNEKTEVPSASGRTTRTMTRLPDIDLLQNSVASTTTRSEVANSWQGVGVHDLKQPQRVVIRFRAPRTSLLSVPAFGVNISEESELVMMGTRSLHWDAWRDTAPEFNEQKISLRLWLLSVIEGRLQIDMYDNVDGNWLAKPKSTALRDRLTAWQLDDDFEALHPREGDGKFAHKASGGVDVKPAAKADTEKKGKIKTITTKDYNFTAGKKVFGDASGPHQYAEDVVDALPGGNHDVIIRSGDLDNGEAFVQIKIYDEDAGSEIVRSFIRRANGDLTVHHDYFVLPSKDQGEGHGKAIMREQMRHYDKLGVTQVDTWADLKVGSYAWARYGFELAPGAEKEFSQLLEHHLIKQDIGDDGHQHDRFNKRERGIIRAVVKGHTKNGELDPKVVWALADLRDSDGSKLGQKLLQKMNWDGVLALKDPRTRARITKYIALPTQQPPAKTPAHLRKDPLTPVPPKHRGPDFAVRYPDGTLSDYELWKDVLGDDLDDPAVHESKRLSLDDDFESKHPRGEGGKFTEKGSGSESTADDEASVRTMLDAEDRKKSAVQDAAASVAEHMGFDVDRIEVTTESRDFEVAGRTLSSAGHFDPTTGIITMHADQIHSEGPALNGLVAHEVSHAQKNTFDYVRAKEHQELTIRLLRGGIDLDTPEQVAAIERQFPASALAAKHSPNGDQYLGFWSLKPDGTWAPDPEEESLRAGVMETQGRSVSNYARLYWEQVEAIESGKQAGKIDRAERQAEHETLAEVARYREHARHGVQSASMDPSERWQRYGKAMEDAYPALKKLDTRHKKLRFSLWSDSSISGWDPEEHPRDETGKFVEKGGAPVDVKKMPGYQENKVENRALSDTHRTAIQFYSRGPYAELNASLRHPSADTEATADKAGWTDERVAALDDAFVGSATTDDQVVYRGLRGDSSTKIRNLPVGKRFRDDGYVSTSQFQQVAEDFGTVVAVELPKGTSALVLGEEHGLTGEHEVLLPRGTEYEVIQNSPTHGMVIRVVPKSGAPSVSALPAPPPPPKPKTRAEIAAEIAAKFQAEIKAQQDRERAQRIARLRRDLEWDPELHPKAPAGAPDSTGGQFVAKDAGGGGTSEALSHATKPSVKGKNIIRVHDDANDSVVESVLGIGSERELRDLAESMVQYVDQERYAISISTEGGGPSDEELEEQYDSYVDDQRNDARAEWVTQRADRQDEIETLWEEVQNEPKPENPYGDVSDYPTLPLPGAEFQEREREQISFGDLTDGLDTSGSFSDDEKEIIRERLRASAGPELLSRAEMREEWDDTIGQDFEPNQSLSEYIDDNRADSSGDEAVEISFKGDRGTNMTRVFRRDENGDLVVDHSFFKAFKPKAGEPSIGKDVMRGLFDEYEKLGVDKVTVHANIDVGGYAWAKYGFRLQENSSPSVDYWIRAAERKGRITAEERQMLEDVATEYDGEDTQLWHIADLKNGDKKIGSEVLLDTDWYGEIRLNDKEAMGRLRSYIAQPEKKKAGAPPAPEPETAIERGSRRAGERAPSNVPTEAEVRAAAKREVAHADWVARQVQEHPDWTIRDLEKAEEREQRITQALQVTPKGTRREGQSSMSRIGADLAAARRHADEITRVFDELEGDLSRGAAAHRKALAAQSRTVAARVRKLEAAERAKVKKDEAARVANRKRLGLAADPPDEEPEPPKPSGGSNEMFYIESDGSKGDRELWRDMLGDDFPDEPAPPKQKALTYREKLALLLDDDFESKHPRDPEGQFTESYPSAARPYQIEKAEEGKRACCKPGQKSKLGKQKQGVLGEAIVAEYLATVEGDDVHAANAEESNYPVDMVTVNSDGSIDVVEAKSGGAGNTRGAQQWRLTIGEPGPREKEMLAEMSDADKERWNDNKEEQILVRKEIATEKVAKDTGREVRRRTITTIIDEKTGLADLYEFEGWHARIGWNSEQAKRGYLGTFRYKKK